MNAYESQASRHSRPAGIRLLGEVAATEPKGVAEAGVPPGWRRHYATLLHGLRATATPARAALNISRPSLENGVVLIRTTASDPVIGGLVRKAQARMMTTCMDCGRAGKPRQLGFKVAVVCAPCHMERRLRLQLAVFSSFMTTRGKDESGIVNEAQVPPLVRYLITDDAWRWMPILGAGGEVRMHVKCLTLAQCRQLMPMIRALRSIVGAC